MNHCNDFANCFLSVAHHRLICPLSFLCVCLGTFVSSAERDCASPMSFRYGNDPLRQNHTIAHSPASVTSHCRAETTPVVRTPSRSTVVSQQRMDSSRWLHMPRQREISFKLTESVTGAEFLTSFCRGGQTSLLITQRAVESEGRLLFLFSFLSDLPFGASQLINDPRVSPFSFSFFGGGVFLTFRGLLKCQPQVCAGCTDGMSICKIRSASLIGGEKSVFY